MDWKGLMTSSGMAGLLRKVVSGERFPFGSLVCKRAAPPHPFLWPMLPRQCHPIPRDRYPPPPPNARFPTPFSNLDVPPTFGRPTWSPTGIQGAQGHPHSFCAAVSLEGPPDIGCCPCALLTSLSGFPSPLPSSACPCSRCRAIPANPPALNWLSWTLSSSLPTGVNSRPSGQCWRLFSLLPALQLPSTFVPHRGQARAFHTPTEPWPPAFPCFPSARTIPAQLLPNRQLSSALTWNKWPEFSFLGLCPTQNAQSDNPLPPRTCWMPSGKVGSKLYLKKMYFGGSGLWDLSSPTEDWTHALCTGSSES